MGSVRNLSEVTRALSRLATHGRRTARRAGRNIADAVADEERDLLGMRRHPKGTPTPSAPGQPPAMVTGWLRDHIRVTGPTGGAEGYAISRVGPTAVYGRIHELGGVCGRGHRTHLPARPALPLAWKLVRRRAGRIMRDAWDNES